MFDIGWTELMLIGVVALIVIGPQDLPDMFRQLGRFTAKLRSMSRDFTRAMEQAAKESGVGDLAKDINSIASPKSMGLSAVKDAADKFEKWDPLKPSVKAAPAAATAAAPVISPVSAAAQATSAVPASAGPATAALYENKAKRAAILRDTSAKLKAIGKAPSVESAPKPAKPAAKPKVQVKSSVAASKLGRAPATATEVPVAAPVKAAKPRAARKPKAATE
jgi:sec-independent protein translocase protein TatB